MRVVIAFPPNYLAIRRALGRPPQTAIYCWEDAVYNPGRVFVSDQLLAHEAVHSAQQAKMGAANWWDAYLRSVEFRFRQELSAHVAEYLAHAEADRPRALALISDRLASRMYGSMCSRMAARDLLTRGLRSWLERQRAEAPSIVIGSAAS